MYRKKSEGWLKHFDFILWDILCLHTAFVAAYMIRHGVNNPYLDLNYRKIAIIYTTVDLLVILCYGTMKDVLKRGYYREFIVTATHVFLVEVIVVFYMFALHEGSIYSRSTIFLVVIFYFFLTYCVRILWKYRIRSISPYAGKRSLLVVAAYDKAKDFAANICEKNYGMFQVSGFAILDSEMIGKTINDIPVVADLASVTQYLCREWVDEVFVMNPDEDSFTDELVERCMQMGLTVHVELDGISNTIGRKQMVERIGDYTVITSSTNTILPGQELAKRILDIIGGLAGCLFVLILSIFLGPVIYVKSPGPIFFSQNRVGRNGKIFKMYKFRSMYLDAEERKKELIEQNRVKDGMMFKLDWDPRIIGSKKLPNGKVKKGIGNYIRDWSLDEFPQFFNVLKGDMSLVGTRPPTLDEWQKYELHHRARMSMKPGITGLWQVSGRSNITDFEEVVRLDTEYINNWSMGRDLWILLKTVRVMFTQDGAM